MSDPDVPWIRGTCPYDMCSASVKIINSPPYPGSGKESEFIIVEHQIKHPILTGICPATLFHMPLKPEEAEHLRAFAIRDGRKIGEQIQAEANARERRLTEESHRPNGGKNPGRLVHNTWFQSQVWQADQQRAQKEHQSDEILRRDGLIGSGSGMNVGEAIAITREVMDTADKTKVQFGEISSYLGTAMALAGEMKAKALVLDGTESVPALAPMLTAIAEVQRAMDIMTVEIDAATSALSRVQEAGENHINRYQS
jgi:hypothetical protein